MADKKARNGHMARRQRKRAKPVPAERKMPWVNARAVTHARLAAVLDAGDLRFANERFAELLDRLDALQERLNGTERHMLVQAKAATWKTLNTLNELFQARATTVAFMSDDKGAGVH